MTEEKCTICLGDLGEDVGLLVCKHSFCFTCIQKWSKQENSCPNCKKRFSSIDRIRINNGKSKKAKVKVKQASQGGDHDEINRGLNMMLRMLHNEDDLMSRLLFPHRPRRRVPNAFDLMRETFFREEPFLGGHDALHPIEIAGDHRPLRPSRNRDSGSSAEPIVVDLTGDDPTSSSDSNSQTNSSQDPHRYVDIDEMFRFDNRDDRFQRNQRHEDPFFDFADSLLEYSESLIEQREILEGVGSSSSSMPNRGSSSSEVRLIDLQGEEGASGSSEGGRRKRRRLEHAGGNRGVPFSAVAVGPVVNLISDDEFSDTMPLSQPFESLEAPLNMLGPEAASLEHSSPVVLLRTPRAPVRPPRVSFSHGRADPLSTGSGHHMRTRGATPGRTRRRYDGLFSGGRANSRTGRSAGDSTAVGTAAVKMEEN